MRCPQQWLDSSPLLRRAVRDAGGRVGMWTGLFILNAGILLLRRSGGRCISPSGCGSHLPQQTRSQAPAASSSSSSSISSPTHHPTSYVVSHVNQPASTILGFAHSGSASFHCPSHELHIRLSTLLPRRSYARHSTPCDLTRHDVISQASSS